MSIDSRVERLERECGLEGGPCPECERREADARGAAPCYDPERFVEEDEGYTMPATCRRCGRPSVINFVVVMPRELSAA